MICGQVGIAGSVTYVTYGFPSCLKFQIDEVNGPRKPRTLEKL